MESTRLRVRLLQSEQTMPYIPIIFLSFLFISIHFYSFLFISIIAIYCYLPQSRVLLLKLLKLLGQFVGTCQVQLPMAEPIVKAV